MREYRATFRRAKGEIRNPRFVTDETDPEKLAAIAREHLYRIPYLKKDGWTLVGITAIEPTKYEQSEAGIQALAATLIRHIREGKYPPLSRFPGCVEICTDFEASERVASRAIARLRESKYIQSEGRGSARRHFVLPRDMWSS